MSTNGVNTNEDTDMAECDGEKVVTMMDVLQEQQDFEEDANAVLGASDDKNCTYSKGYIKRQAIYACMTCCSDAKEDDTKRAGVCLACSLSCHENHELIELYTKRNFRCDCGNPKFNSHPCQFNSNKNDINEDNKYNQNYSGLYCICHRPYPDPEAKVEDEMIQCIICEDWLHASHLDAIVPPNDQYSEMICKGCMEKNVFLHDYSGLAVAAENSDVDVVSSHDVTTSNGRTSDSVLETCGENAEQNMSVEDVEVNDKTGDNNMKNNTNDETSSITISEPKSITNNAGVEQTKTESVADMVMNMENETNDNNDTQSPTKIDDTEEINMSINDLNGTPQEVTEKLDPNNSQEQAKTNEKTNEMLNISTMKNKNEVKDTILDNTNLLLDKNESHSKMEEEHLLNGEDKCVNEEEKLVNEEEKLVNEEEKLVNEEEKVLNKEETSNHTAAPDDTEMTPIEKSKESTGENTKHEANAANTQISTPQPKDEITNTTEEEPKDELTNNTEEKPQEELTSTMEEVTEDGLTSTTKEEPKDQSIVPVSTTESDKNDSNTNTDEKVTIISTTEADVKDTGPENSKLSNEGEIINTSATDLDSTNIADDNKNKNDSTHSSDITKGNNSIAEDIPSKMVNIAEENDRKNNDEVSKSESMAEESEMQEEKQIAGKTEENEVDEAKQNDHSDIENKVPNEVITNTNENKRKLPMDEEKDNVATKKVKTDQDKSCARPKGGKKHFKGAVFWPSSFRQKLCTCNECLAMYKDLSVLFLIDPEDTVSAYEMLGKEKTEGSPSSQYEKGLQALSSLDRIQQINALTEYNKMRDKLLDFLKSFKDRREIVKEEDIKGFFAGMKPKREPDGVYFCR